METIWEPKKLALPLIALDVPSAWKGLEQVIEPLLDEFNIGRDTCLDMGVDYGFSTVAFSNYFKEVTGIDHFKGDKHAGFRDLYQQVKQIGIPNINFVQSDYKDFIKDNNNYYNLIHIDLVHTYKDTYKAGKWAINHADMVIFHDTESFPEVHRAVEDLREGEWFNYPEHHGLGIIAL